MDSQYLRKLSVLYDTCLKRIPNQSLLKSAIAQIVDSGLTSRPLFDNIASFLTDTPRPKARRLYRAIKNTSTLTRTSVGCMRNSRASRRKTESYKKEEIKKPDKSQLTPIKKIKEAKLREVLLTSIRNIYKVLKLHFPRRTECDLSFIKAQKRKTLLQRSLNKVLFVSGKPSEAFFDIQEGIFKNRNSQRLYCTKKQNSSDDDKSGTDKPNESQKSPVYVFSQHKKSEENGKNVVSEYDLKIDLVYLGNKELASNNGNNKIPESQQEKRQFYLNTIEKDLAYCEETARKLENLVNWLNSEPTNYMTSEMSNFETKIRKSFVRKPNIANCSSPQDVGLKKITCISNSSKNDLSKTASNSFYDRTKASLVTAPSTELFPQNKIIKTIEDGESLLKTNSGERINNKQTIIEIPVKHSSQFEQKKTLANPQEQNQEKKIGTLKISLKIPPPAKEQSIVLLSKPKNESKQKVNMKNSRTITNSSKEKYPTREINNKGKDSLQPVLKTTQELHESRKKTNFSEFYYELEKNKNIKKTIVTGKNQDLNRPKKILCIINKMWAQIEEDAKMVAKDMEIIRKKLQVQRQKLEDVELKIAELSEPGMIGKKELKALANSGEITRQKISPSDDISIKSESLAPSLKKQTLCTTEVNKNSLSKENETSVTENSIECSSTDVLNKSKSSKNEISTCTVESESTPCETESSLYMKILLLKATSEKIKTII